MTSIIKRIFFPRKVFIACGALWISILLQGVCQGQAVNTNSGTDFWFGFTETTDLQSADYVVYINTFKTTKGTISIPGFAWSMNFTVVAGVTTRIVLPSADVVVSSFSAPTSQAVHVVADSNISVFAAIENSERSDNSCILPVSELGNEYYIMDYSLCQSFSEFMIVAQDCKDSVEIIPSHNITVGGNHPIGVPYTEVLQPGQVFLVQCDSDLTGSMVRSLNHSETGVIAGANWNCVACNGTANPFYEELFPDNTWGSDYVFLPTAQAEDECRILSEKNGTVVTLATNAGNNIQTLNAGQYYDTAIDDSAPVYISATNPITVGRFLKTGACNSYYITNPTGKGDPSEVIEDATNQMFLDSITFYVSRTPDIDSTYIQIVTRTADENTIFLDGVNIGAFFKTLIPNPAYAYTSLTILPGSHTLVSIAGKGFVAYTCGLGYLDATACDAGVYLQEISLDLAATSPSNCSAHDGSATATVSGIPPFLYSWSNGETTQTATGLKAGIYTVTVTDSDCVAHKATGTIIINGKAGYTDSIANTNPSCTDSLGKSTANPSGGTAPYTYSWSNGQTTQTATGLAPGTYTCTVTDNTGCLCFAITKIIKYIPPGIGIAPYNDSSCGPQSQLLHVYGLNTGIYNWAPHSGLSCYQCASPTANPAVTTTYTISGADSNGCSASATITLAVLSTPKPIIKGKDSICQGDIDTLTATGGSTYQWSNGGTNDSIIVSPAHSITYTVTASNGFCPPHDTTFTINVLSAASAKITTPKDSFCIGDSVKLTANGGTKYRWNNGSTTNTIWVHPPSAYTYTLYASVGTCSDSATLSVKPISPITASISITKDTVCPNQPTTITAAGQGGSATYKWSNGATSSSITVSDTVTTTYTATIMGVCDSLQKVMTVVVIPLPKPVVNGTVSKCQGMNDTLTVSSSVNPTTYLWNNGATATTIITGTLTEDTTLYVTAYNKLGCPVKEGFTITVKTLPDVTVNPSTVACSGNAVTLKATAKGTGPFTYLWSPGGATTDNISVNPDSTVTYSVTVSNGCLTTKTTQVIPDNPVLSACCDNTILLGDDTILVAHGSTTLPYHWSPSVNCLNPSCDSVQVTPTVTTTYTVTLTDSFGCQLERIITIIVEQRCFDFIVPNVFTPGNAGILGLDNVFYINAQHMDAWSLDIYDRWGKEMYSSTNPGQYWNGNTKSGEKAPAGVYYYIINATCQGNTYKKDGFVQLIR